nr:MAG TPA: PsbL protein [Caudoviricetes sp.]
MLLIMVLVILFSSCYNCVFISYLAYIILL